MEREKRILSETDAYYLASEEYDIDDLDYDIVETIVLDVDFDDGGCEYKKILLEKSTNKYFSLIYNDWDVESTNYNHIDDSFNKCNIDNEINEVFPKEITKTIYI